MTKLLISLRNTPLKRIISILLRALSVDIPSSVKIGKNFTLPHRGQGVVIHPATIIGDNVKIYQQVTLGRSDIWNARPSPNFIGIEIGSNVIIGAGAKILTSSHLKIGTNTIIGANSVLTKSTGANEVWAGIPAKLIKPLIIYPSGLNNAQN